MRYLFILIALMLPLPALSGSCEIHAEAIVGWMEFDILGCEIKGALIQNKKTKLLSGVFKVDIRKLTTNRKDRDEHMHDKYLQSKKYPTAKFVLDGVRPGAKKFRGRMTLHGKTRKITGRIVKSSIRGAEVTFDLDITDFGIKKPGYESIVIGQNLKIRVSI